MNWNEVARKCAKHKPDGIIGDDGLIHCPKCGEALQLVIRPDGVPITVNRRCSCPPDNPAGVVYEGILKPRKVGEKPSQNDLDKMVDVYEPVSFAHVIRSNDEESKRRALEAYSMSGDVFESTGYADIDREIAFMCG